MTTETSFKKLSIHICRMSMDKERQTLNAEELNLANQFIRDAYVSGFIIATKANFGAYQVVANFSVFRAARQAGFETVPAIVGSFDSHIADELSMIDNILKGKVCSIEEAEFHRDHIGKSSRRQYAIRNNLSPTTLRNKLQLLKLAKNVQEMVKQHQISVGQARTIAYLSSHKDQRSLAQLCEKSSISVRRLEQYVHQKKSMNDILQSKDPDITRLENNMAERLGFPVHIKSEGKSGQMLIDFHQPLSLVNCIKTMSPIVSSKILVAAEIKIKELGSMTFKVSSESKSVRLAQLINSMEVGTGFSARLVVSYNSLSCFDQVYCLLTGETEDQSKTKEIQALDDTIESLKQDNQELRDKLSAQSNMIDMIKRLEDKVQGIAGDD